MQRQLQNPCGFLGTLLPAFLRKSNADHISPLSNSTSALTAECKQHFCDAYLVLRDGQASLASPEGLWEAERRGSVTPHGERPATCPSLRIQAPEPRQPSASGCRGLL
uniref:Uncharacterized protein n=1 Tax=Amazona collaria TaxID=241587 RepID=A0A8B9FIV3_9PSIT